MPGFVGSGGFVKALAARGRGLPLYFSYCLDRSILTFSVASKKLKTQPHNAPKKLRRQNKTNLLKSRIRKLFKYHIYMIYIYMLYIYIILRAALSFRGICGWQCSMLGGWELWARVVVLPVQKGLPRGVHRYSTEMCAAPHSHLKARLLLKSVFSH